MQRAPIKLVVLYVVFFRAWKDTAEPSDIFGALKKKTCEVQEKVYILFIFTCT